MAFISWGIVSKRINPCNHIAQIGTEHLNYLNKQQIQLDMPMPIDPPFHSDDCDICKAWNRHALNNRYSSRQYMNKVWINGTGSVTVYYRYRDNSLKALANGAIIRIEQEGFENIEKWHERIERELLRAGVNLNESIARAREHYTCSNCRHSSTWR